MTSLHHEQKSPWAIVVIIIVFILFGIFWLSQRPKSVSIKETPVTENKPNLIQSTAELEASVGNITIPEYSETE